MKLNTQIEGFSQGSNILSIDIPEQLERTAKTGLSFIDASFGGEGMTPSVCTLFTGVPGAGKTTLMLQLSNSLTKQGHIVLFNTAEESLFQVRRTAKRLGLKHGFACGDSNHIPTILETCDNLKKDNPGKQLFLIVDSLQMMDDGKFESGRITSSSAERALQEITNYCKENWAIAIVVGQVNKAGKFSGTSKLKHMVDAHMHLKTDTDERSDNFGYRILEMQKNRFGGANMAFILDMSSSGLKEFGSLYV